jgi:beta-mannosidase
MKGVDMMSKISLDGSWNLLFFPEGEYQVNTPKDCDNLPVTRIQAHVPGNVELDMVRAGRLSEPFYADNIRKLRPLEYNEYWYSRDFDLPLDAIGAEWDLVFAGLDTLATVWVNDILVGQSANMLVEQRFKAGYALLAGEKNRITIRLKSPLIAAQQYHYDAMLSGSDMREEGLFIRKAPHMWGWDIMPRAVSAGIWRSVWLEEHKGNAIEQLYYSTIEINRDGGVLGVRFQFRIANNKLDNLLLRFKGVCGDHSFEYQWQPEFIAGGCRIFIPGAKLWYPRGYGMPNLYTVTVQLCQDGQVLDERIDRIGIRKLLVHRTEVAGSVELPKSAGGGIARVDVPVDADSHFYFTVNGDPVMVKGANWVPLDAFHSRDAERVDQALALFNDLGCNMIRCWGGNVYEDHHFFDVCDENGVMIWQDFAYACSHYPQTEDFLSQVRVEVQSVVEKLRNHASLAVWCGDNEIDMMYLMDGLSPEQNRLTREVIPQVVHRCDPNRPFIPSSPYVPPLVAKDPNNAWQRTPEQHLWGPRGYYKGQFYTEHNAHFIGEIGYHGCPSLISLKKFLSPEKLWGWEKNDEWQVHSVYHWQYPQINRDRIKLMANQVKELFGMIPDNIEDFVLASQITQAEAKKFFIESTRLRKWRTSGVLWWNVIDGWPQFSDAVVDYYFEKKLAYHYIKRSQNAVCLIIGEAGSGKYLPVVACNDTLSPVEMAYKIWDIDTQEVILDGVFTVPANQNWQVGVIRTFASEQGFYRVEYQVNGETYHNHYLVGSPPFELERYKEWLKKYNQ